MSFEPGRHHIDFEEGKRQNPRLRKKGESLEDYRVAMGWDKPKAYTWDELKKAVEGYEKPENEPVRELYKQHLERVLKSFPKLSYKFEV